MGATTIDRGAFDQAILQLQPNLMHLALGLTRDAGEARDLVQDALERALREWTRFTPGTNTRAWLSAILSRLFIDRWRRRKRQPRFVDIDRADVDFAATGPGRQSTSVNASEWPLPLEEEPPAAACWETVTDTDLAAAIAALPVKLRLVFEMSAGEHRSYLEISRAVGIPVNTVGTRLLRARRRLRVALEARMATRTALADAERAATLVPAPRAQWAPPPLGPGAARPAWSSSRAGQSARRSMSARASDAQGVVPSPASRPM